MAEVQWSFPAWNPHANPWAKCQPRIEAILAADEMAMAALRAELAAALLDVKEKTARIASLEHTAASWKNYQPGGSASSQPTGYQPTGYQPYGSSSSSSSSQPTGYQPTGYQPYGSSSSSSSSQGGSWIWVWDKPPTDPNKKSGWLNKMVAMLAAIYHGDSKRIEHLARV
jgi:hypothetical protein